MAGMLLSIAHAGATSAQNKSANALRRTVREFITQASLRADPGAFVLLLAADATRREAGKVPSPASFQFTQELAVDKEKRANPCVFFGFEPLIRVPMGRTAGDARTSWIAEESCRGVVRDGIPQLPLRTVPKLLVGGLNDRNSWHKITAMTHPIVTLPLNSCNCTSPA
jgi:hypothetical protein